MLKRILAFVMCAILALALAACGPSSEPSKPSEPAQTTQAAEPTQAAPEAKKYVIGYDIYFLGNSWSVQMYKEFQAEVEKHKDVISDVVYVDSQGNAEKQVRNIQDLIAKNVDCIITTPNNPTALIPTLKKAREKGIKVILVGALIDSKDYDALITVDDTQFGVAGAEWLVEKMGGKGNIICLNGIAGLSTNEMRFNGAKSVFDKYPDIKIVGAVNADWDYAKAKMQASNLLAAHKNIDGVWSQGGAMTLGVIESFEAAKRPLVPMTGEDNNGLLKVWKDRQASGFDCVAPAKPTWLGSEGLITALKVLKGESVVQDNIIPVPMVKGDELDKYVRTDLPDEFWCMTRLNDQQIKAMFSETKK